ncbi:MAG TPA: VOC family protein [Streptosporangiaceae bacterium]|nr:VOC family protein [Streptosporangiaceae bacterium]
MATIRDVIFDSRHPASIARFWAVAIDGYRVAPYDDAELARLRGIGINDPEDDPAVLVEPVTGRGPRLFFQRVPEGRTVKNRVHLDLDAPDADAEADRLTRLGARMLATYENWITLADPEGNEFCIQRAAAAGTTP